MTNTSCTQQVVGLFMAACVMGASTAGADPVVVRSGGYYEKIDETPWPWVFAGDGFYFEMHAYPPSSESYFGPRETCWACRRGELVDLSTRMLGFTGTGDSTAGSLVNEGAVLNPARINGVTYPVLYYTGNLIFNAPSVYPESMSEWTNWIEEGTFLGNDQPLAFFGHITAYTNASLMGSPVFNWDLVGRGMAGAHLRVHFDDAGGDSGYRSLFSFRYSFSEDAAAPVPEPSTLLLVGSALLGAAIRRRRAASGGDR